MNEQHIETPQRFGSEPLYRGFRDDYSEQARGFTVTIAGAERHDGEKPCTYVVDGHDTESAWAQALAYHLTDTGMLDCYVVAGESFEGTPDADYGKEWTDLRPEPKRKRNDGRAPVPLNGILYRVRLAWPDAGWVLREPPTGKPSLTWRGGPTVEEVGEELRWPDIDMQRTA